MYFLKCVAPYTAEKMSDPATLPNCLTRLGPCAAPCPVSLG